MPRKRRHPPLSYHPPERLRAEFHARVLNSGLSVNAFITRAVFGLLAPRARRRAGLDQQAAARLLVQAARISDRLERHGGGAAGSVPVLDECRDELAAIRTLLMSALGRER